MKKFELVKDEVLFLMLKFIYFSLYAETTKEVKSIKAVVPSVCANLCVNVFMEIHDSPITSVLKSILKVRRSVGTIETSLFI